MEEEDDQDDIVVAMPVVRSLSNNSGVYPTASIAAPIRNRGDFLKFRLGETAPWRQIPMANPLTIASLKESIMASCPEQLTSDQFSITYQDQERCVCSLKLCESFCAMHNLTGVPDTDAWPLQ